MKLNNHQHNYLISTFDGLGDGVIYYPIIRSVAEGNPRNLFYCATNLFFSDKDILEKLDLPKNIKFVTEEFRKFPEENYNYILNFLSENNIKKIINLRFIGRDFEKGYFKFKDHAESNNLDLNFYDSENISFFESNHNARSVVLKIFENTLGGEIKYNEFILKTIFPVSDDSDAIFINMHSRGDFKLWNINKWSEVISSMVFYGKKVYVYDGYDEKEKEYTRKVFDNLSQIVKGKINLLVDSNLLDLISTLQKAKLLISVDSGLIHLADAVGVESIGIYLTTSPRMWGGVTEKFHFVQSLHMRNCKKFYKQFGMCMNGKKKCEEIEGESDDIDIHEIFNIVNNIYEKEN